MTGTLTGTLSIRETRPPSNEEKAQSPTPATSVAEDVYPRWRPPLVVVGGFLTYFCTYGFMNAWGTFQFYYHEVLLAGMSNSKIAWIGALQLFILSISGLVVGPLYDTWGATRIFAPGAVLYVLAIMFASVSSQYYQLILAQGILLGLGTAMLFFPTITAVSQWYGHSRGFALGIVVSGSSLGGICWPLMLERLIRQIGFPWAMRTAGFLCLALLAPSAFLVVSRPRIVRERMDDQDRRPPNVIHSLFKDLLYIALVIGMFLVQWGMFIPFFYLPTYGSSNGMDADEANNLVSYLNAGSFVGRIASGYVADLCGRLNVTFGCSAVCAVLVFCLHAITGKGSIIAFSVLYGIFSGGLISLQAACVSQITADTRILGLRIGAMMAACSFAGLTGSPIAGALISHDHGAYGDMINFSGIVLSAGAIVLAGARGMGAPGVKAF
ncbi:monocarboxylate transporter [Aspergillus ibericus CBS 121593]|uniref:Monocarboxylate transporter n=1 Tax=Aspergillus ibericus CBS 121593 TaxID=1448316 RepID=A0A395GSE4_9EURO|nr:monocarboxylate transporter [Aspergillus ibericus CBS 121593]RAK98500.1 monocarboxylate transporter [Aspergillus ibericus CBS 121593]